MASIHAASDACPSLNDTHRAREWNDEDIAFLRSTARQLAIGYQYTSIFVAQQKESKRTKALLEIANTLNSHSNFSDVADGVLERAIALVGADYSALGVLDETGKRISLATFKSAEGIKPARVLKLVEQHGNQALRVADRAYVMERGRITISGTTEEVGDQIEQIEAAYLAAGT